MIYQRVNMRMRIDNACRNCARCHNRDQCALCAAKTSCGMPQVFRFIHEARDVCTAVLNSTDGNRSGLLNQSHTLFKWIYKETIIRTSSVPSSLPLMILTGRHV